MVEQRDNFYYPNQTPAKLIEHQDRNSQLGLNFPIKPLLRFEDAVQPNTQAETHHSLSDYLLLVHRARRLMMVDKTGSIPSKQPPILTRLNIPFEQWLFNNQNF
ncbi:MAG: hypothetical protein GYB33_08695 [Gammaproteobacteria bacterium]|nr:hypothetical protein [Gammaproteobacteria bacterium]